MSWDYDANLALAKRELANWEWGIDVDSAEALVRKICEQAASVVLRQISDDLRSGSEMCDLNEQGDLIVWSMSGDHFMVRFNASAAINKLVEPNEINDAGRRAVAISLRKLADHLDGACKSD